MEEDFWGWFRKFSDCVRWVLKPYGFIEDGTGEDVNFRRFYMRKGKSKNEGFILHLQPRHTLDKINVYFGLPENQLKVPKGYSGIRPTDQKNQCQIDIYMKSPYYWPLILLLAVQVAKAKSVHD